MLLASGFALLLTATPADAVCFNHSLSGIEFGAAPEGIRCSVPRILDPERGDCSLAYKPVAHQQKLTLTAFVYRRLPPLSKPNESPTHQLKAVKTEVAGTYKDLACESWTPPRAGMIGLRCFGHNPQIGPDKLVTFIGLEAVGPWWLKIRATAPVDEKASSEEAIAAIVSTIKAAQQRDATDEAH